jgi:hypothetical protein
MNGPEPPGGVPVERPDADRRFYFAWILANGLSELVGLGGTFLMGFLLAPVLVTSSSAVTILSGAAAAILLGTLLEGVVVGAAQSRVLRTRLAGLGGARWIAATALGAGAAWTLGMLPSTVLALATRETAAAPAAPPEMNPLLQYVAAAAMGAVLGPFLGIPQARVLARYVPEARRWIAANVVAWTIGMPVIFIGLDVVDPGVAGPLRLAFGIALTCLTTGVVVGAVHGRWLTALLSRA